MKTATISASSRFRKLYLVRLVQRILIFGAMVLLWLWRPKDYEITLGFHFFDRFNILQIVWVIWMGDMILQMRRAPFYWPLGSQKYRRERYEARTFSRKSLEPLIQKNRRDTWITAFVWILFVGLIDGLYLYGWIPYQAVVLCSGFFYVCDLICVLFWCPFRVFIMHNKCCTTCRIFNWDHAMMFLPLVVLPGFFTWSLVLVSWLIVAQWELAYARHPERFCEISNTALQCRNCTDRLCGRPADPR